jgi:hypothetical protein
MSEQKSLDATERVVEAYREWVALDPRPLSSVIREAADVEIRRLVEALDDVMGRLPHDFRGSTFWEDDDGTFMEHEWHKKARAILANAKGEQA